MIRSMTSNAEFISFAGQFHSKLTNETSSEEYKGTTYNIHFEPIPNSEKRRMIVRLHVNVMNEYKLIDMMGKSPKVFDTNCTEEAKDFYKLIMKDTTYVNIAEAVNADPAKYFCKDTGIKNTDNFNFYYRDLDPDEFKETIELITGMTRGGQAITPDIQPGPSTPTGGSKPAK